MLGLNKRVISENRVLFSQLCPELFDEKSKGQYLNAHARCLANFNFLTHAAGIPESDLRLGLINEEDVSGQQRPKSDVFYCNLKELSFEGASNIGYIVKLTERDDSLSSIPELSGAKANIPSLKSHFAYEPTESKFVIVSHEESYTEHGIHRL